MTALDPRRRPGTWVVVADPGDGIAHAAAIEEDEGRCLVVPIQEATARGLATGPELVWITLGADTTLDQVGVTALFAGALADAGVAANVLAGLHHDHVLVPVEQADEAISVLGALHLS